MDRPSSRPPSEGALLHRLAYLVRRSTGMTFEQARDRAAEILMLSSPASPREIVRLALHPAGDRREDPAEPGHPDAEREILSGLAGLSEFEARVFAALLGDTAHE
jgi:hypothetical protein